MRGNGRARWKAHNGKGKDWRYPSLRQVKHNARGVLAFPGLRMPQHRYEECAALHAVDDMVKRVRFLS